LARSSQKNVVTLRKQDSHSEMSTLVKRSLFLAFAIGTAAATVYLFGEELREVVAISWQWTVDHISISV